MNGESKPNIILEYNVNGIADRRSDERPEDAQMLPLGETWLQSRESFVRVLAIDGLQINRLLILFVLFFFNRKIGNIMALGRVVPLDFVRPDVISENGARLWLCNRLALRRRDREKAGGKKAQAKKLDEKSCCRPLQSGLHDGEWQR